MSEVLNLLIVDDELGIRMGVERVLRNFTAEYPELGLEVTFKVTSAGSGEEGMERIQASPPDLLLLDYKLPGINGLDVLLRLAEQKFDILTVMITAYASLETAVVATKNGAFDFLAKPFTPEELKQNVRKSAKHLLLQRQARRLAEEKRQVRFQFISVLAHELKSPLNAVEGNLRIIKDRTAGDDAAAYALLLDRSLIRLEGMRKLILDLLDLTRIESGQKKREITEVDVGDVARVALESVAPDAANRKITTALHLAQPVKMLADRGEIEIILNNLVSNAVKYNRDEGRVDVTLDLRQGQVMLTVADTGIGMTPEECGRLFQDFVRIKNAKTRNILGSGLGLSIVKKLANLYGGDALVQSTPDVGTTFTVRLCQDRPPVENARGD